MTLANKQEENKATNLTPNLDNNKTNLTPTLEQQQDNNNNNNNPNTLESGFNMQDSFVNMNTIK